MLLQYFSANKGWHSVQRSKQDLKELLLRFLASYNETCNGFTWTKGPSNFSGSSKPPGSIRPSTPKNLAAVELNEKRPIL
jgi:hypothetical protein